MASGSKDFITNLAEFKQ